VRYIGPFVGELNTGVPSAFAHSAWYAKMSLVSPVAMLQLNVIAFSAGDAVRFVGSGGGNVSMLSCIDVLSEKSGVPPIVDATSHCTPIVDAAFCVHFVMGCIVVGSTPGFIRSKMWTSGELPDGTSVLMSAIVAAWVQNSA
jgi:hypothetical protein